MYTSFVPILMLGSIDMEKSVRGTDVNAQNPVMSDQSLASSVLMRRECHTVVERNVDLYCRAR
jgi:hypothetical protein